MADTEEAPQSQLPPQQQQDPASQPQQAKMIRNKPVVAEKVSGIVKWFNVKSGFGFIHRDDTKEDVFVHHTAITRKNPRKVGRTVGDGEAVEFSVVNGEKGFEAVQVTGPGGTPVQGSLNSPAKRVSKKRQLALALDALDSHPLSKALKGSKGKRQKAVHHVS